MTKTRHIIFAMGAAMLCSMSACNSDSDSDFEVQGLGGVAVTAFSLQSNGNVLHNLDSVFFSIDLVNAEIFNADSLPCDTKINALKLSISSDPASEMTLSYAVEDGSYEQANYLNDNNVEVNFAYGPVKLHMVSQDGVTSRDYTIRVNVHKMSPDSLYWASSARTDLPTSLSTPESQRAVRMADKAYCLTSSTDGYSMAVSDNPYGNKWTVSAPSFPENVDVRSMTATSTSLYILTVSGSLLKSADGMTWTDTGEKWRSITAPYEDRLLGVKISDGHYFHAEYPAGNTILSEVEDGFPLSGNAGAVMLDSKWSAAKQVITVGGRDKDGNLLSGTWGYDGTSWACLSDRLPAGEGYAVAPYTVCKTDTVTWRVTESDVILAIGGRKATGVKPDVYISRDYGINWTKAYDELLLPQYIPGMYNADLLVFDTTLPLPVAPGHSKGWMEMPVKTPLALGAPMLRGAVLPEKWDCPFLYLIGGHTAGGSLEPYIWRGAVNHFLFRPIF